MLLLDSRKQEERLEDLEVGIMWFLKSIFAMELKVRISCSVVC